MRERQKGSQSPSWRSRAAYGTNSRETSGKEVVNQEGFRAFPPAKERGDRTAGEPPEQELRLPPRFDRAP